MTVLAQSRPALFFEETDMAAIIDDDEDDEMTKDDKEKAREILWTHDVEMTDVNFDALEKAVADALTAARAEATFLAGEGMRMACIKVLTDHAKHCHPEESAGLIELAEKMSAIEAKAKEAGNGN